MSDADVKKTEYDLLTEQTQSQNARIASLLAVVLLFFYWITPKLNFGGMGVVALMTLLSLFLILLFTVHTSRAIVSLKAKFVHLILSAMCAAPFLINPKFPSPIVGLRMLLMMWFAISIGVLLAHIVKEIKILLPISVTLALVDLYVVFGGGMITQAIKQNDPAAQEMMKRFTVSLPKTHTPRGAAPMELMIGFADFLFIGLFFACFTQFKIPSQRTMWVMIGFLTAYMIFVAITGIPLPALVPIAIVVLGMNLKHFKYERSEAFALLYAGLIVVSVLGGMTYRNSKKIVQPPMNPSEIARPVRIK